MRVVGPVNGLTIYYGKTVIADKEILRDISSSEGAFTMGIGVYVAVSREDLVHGTGQNVRLDVRHVLRLAYASSILRRQVLGHISLVVTVFVDRLI